jgi:hypothetical protein
MNYFSFLPFVFTFPFYSNAGKDKNERQRLAASGSVATDALPSSVVVFSRGNQFFRRKSWEKQQSWVKQQTETA